MLGRQRVERLVHACADGSSVELAASLLAEMARHGEGAPQDDDITMVLLKRSPVR
jgi:serine phosphatase RsbU (regulator of sigma subunit)